jgi:hypothetical protein
MNEFNPITNNLNVKRGHFISKKFDIERSLDLMKILDVFDENNSFLGVHLKESKRNSLGLLVSLPKLYSHCKLRMSELDREYSNGGGVNQFGNKLDIYDVLTSDVSHLSKVKSLSKPFLIGVTTENECDLSKYNLLLSPEYMFFPKPSLPHYWRANLRFGVKSDIGNNWQK